MALGSAPGASHGAGLAARRTSSGGRRIVLGALAACAPAALLTGCEVPALLRGAPLKCPMGYTQHKGHLTKGGQLQSSKSIEECASMCDEENDCLSIEFSPSEKLCILNNLGGRPESGSLRDFKFCEKPTSKSIASLMLGPEEYREQEGAQIQAGGNVRVYVVGSSNVLWMTWIDQLHLYLMRLGYKVPAIPAKTNYTYFPTAPQTCDDTPYFTTLKTSRLGKIGWHSWDFTYEDWGECETDEASDKFGYRRVADYKVKCEHGPGCNFGHQNVPVSAIAEDASWSDITLVTTWFNDDQPDARKCFFGVEIPKQDIANMSITGLLRTTRAIHNRNPDVWVVILAKYSNFRRFKLPWVEELHRIVKAAVEKEPRTLFVDYDRPHPGHWNAWELWQKAHPNHPNCRGSKLMAHSILERLFKEKVLARTLKLVNKGVNVNKRNCHQLSGAICHTSVLCWLDPKDKVCKLYSGGSDKFYDHAELVGMHWETAKFK